jgi:2-iminobutanoate/2-iminopropanoate deaminase
MQIISSEKAPAAVGPYSHAVRTGNLLFCAGMLPLVPSTMKIEATEIEGQTTQVLTNIQAVLAAAGLTTANVVKSTVFLKDLGDFAKMNALYDAAFAGHKPARSTVQVAKLPLDALVEIEVIAEFQDAA